MAVTPRTMSADGASSKDRQRLSTEPHRVESEPDRRKLHVLVQNPWSSLFLALENPAFIYERQPTTKLNS